MVQFTSQSRKLIIALDLGTTFSGAAYAILEPGELEEAKIRSVTRYPRQADNAGASKVPTVLLYDSQGIMRAAGAEAFSTDIEEEAEEENWTKVEWYEGFKLYLHPDSLPDLLRNKSPDFPEGKSITDVLADFFRYLSDCAIEFIRESHPTMKNTWDDWEAKTYYVISHPNAWGGEQQADLRAAAISAGLISSSPTDANRVVFVSEGEASLHYCIKGEFLDESDRSFIIADLGGGTLDFSVYKTSGRRPYRVQEIAESKSMLEGSVILTQRAHSFFKQKLQGSVFGADEQIEEILKKFDQTTKLTFVSSESPCNIKFGSLRDNDPEYSISKGRLRLAGEDVAALFEPCLTVVANTIEEYLTVRNIDSVYLVGGFSASVFLKDELEKRLGSSVSINTPDGQSVKAVAEGAVSFFIDHYVNARCAKFAYGSECGRPYDRTDPEHLKRKGKLRRVAFSRPIVPNGFHELIRKGQIVSEREEHRFSLYREVEAGSSLKICSTICAFRGDGPSPQWLDEDDTKDLFKKLCSVTATIRIPASGTRSADEEGSQLRRFYYDVVLFFGGTELCAQVAWKTEEGEEIRGQAMVVYDLSDDDD